MLKKEKKEKKERKERKDPKEKKEKKDKKGKKEKGKKREKEAATADRHALYQQAVQSPKNDISFFLKVFHMYRSRKPISLKEDFCGTAVLSAEWVKSSVERTAVGVDLDKPTLEWGKQYNSNNIGPAVERITFIHDNVLNVKSPKVDIVASLNYSFCVFKQRAQIVQYFQTVAQSLNKEGIFICDIFGGAEAIVPSSRSRDYGSFLYTWEQEWFNPLTHDIRCHIHFSFKDGSAIKRAFTYDWRWWSLPELKECMLQAGFSSVKFWWKNEKRSAENRGKISKAKKEEEEEPKSEEENNGSGEDESEEEESEEEADPLSGDEMEEYIEVETIKQTKSWNAYVIGII